jgi:hypothetical protein
MYDDGINGKHFGPWQWKMWFAVADSIDQQHEKLSEEDLDRCKTLFLNLYRILPCAACRTSAKCFLDTPPHTFMSIHNTTNMRNTRKIDAGFVDFIFWLRVMVNRKIFQQRIEEERDPDKGEDIRSEWRSYHVPRIQVQPIALDSTLFFRALLITLYYCGVTNSVRSSLLMFTRDLSRILQILGQHRTSEWLRTLWKPPGVLPAPHRMCSHLKKQADLYQ